MIRVAITVAVVVGAAEPTGAQDRPRVELAGGYQILKLQSGPLDAAGVGTFFPLGWFFEAAAPVSSGLTLVGQLSGQYRSGSQPSTSAVVSQTAEEHLRVYSFLAGARIVGRREDGLTAFFHLLGGVSRVGLTQSTAQVPGTLLPLLGVGGATTGFTLQAGGGFDFPLASRWSGRMTADYVRLSTEGEPTHGVRVAIGWVVPLGR